MPENPFGEDTAGYEPWKLRTKSDVRDIRFVPAGGPDQRIRMLSYIQIIDQELHGDATQLALQFRTSGVVVFIEGKGLDGLSEQISEKRVQSVHVYDPETDGPEPETVVTKLRFVDDIEDAMR